MTSRRVRRAVPVAFAAAAFGVGSLAAVAYAATSVRTVSNKGNEFAFTKRLTAPPGTVTLVFRNSGYATHDIALRGKRLATKRGAQVRHGKTSRVRAKLPKGTYTYFCTVPGHEAAGMRGTLVVR